jgi:hypothetical protein
MKNPELISSKALLYGDYPGRPRWVQFAVSGLLALCCILPECSGIGPPPSITQPPQSTNAIQGTAVILSVTAASPTAMTYQWHFYGRIIPGATNSSLTLANLQPVQAGPYSVSIQNAGGTAVSTSASVSVFGRYSFTASTPIEIPEQGVALPYPSTIAVSNLVGSISRVTVALEGLSHEVPDDLDVWLVGPGGTTVLLMSDVGDGKAVTGIRLEFNDAAAARIPDSGPLLSGSYKPTDAAPADDPTPLMPGGILLQNLGGFAGRDPNGPWSLYVVDDTAWGGGAIASGWRLNLTLIPPGLGTFHVSLGGSNEVPANSSPAGGSGILRLLADGTLSYSISYAGLKGAFSSARIGGPARPGANAGDLFELHADPWNSWAGVLIGGAGDYDGQQIGDVRNGLHFVRLRSTAFPAGEIRGQILPLLPPTLIDQPESQNVLRGEAVTFRVAARSPSPMSYQWRHNQAPVPDATNAALRLEQVQLDDNGVYDVLVGNAAGSSASWRAALTVLSEPEPETVKLALGSSGSQAIRNSGPLQAGQMSPCGLIGPSARWLGLVPEANGTLILETTGSTVDTVMAFHIQGKPYQELMCNDNGPQGGTYSWIAVQVAPGVHYAVEVDGVHGVQGLIQLNWHFGLEPVILRHPAGQTVTAGEPITLQVRAEGAPAPVLRWRFNGAELPGETNEALVIRSAKAQHAGVYSVTASNFIGTTVSSNAFVCVSQPPLLSPPALDNRGFHFFVRSAPGQPLLIESSPDLKGWTPVLLTNPPEGEMEFVEPAFAVVPQRFYRAQSR